MSDLSTVYKELLASNEGDILVKLKDGKQLRIISFLINKRSPVFRTMMRSSMKEAASGEVDLSQQYSLEAFQEFMAYIYYNKQYAGSYIPLLFEILCIADYYEVAIYRRYINDWIVKLITTVPVCLTIAFEAQKHGTLTSEIYAECLRFLKNAAEPQSPEKYSGFSRPKSYNSVPFGGFGAPDIQIQSSIPLVTMSDLPDFILDDVVSFKIDNEEDEIIYA
jgi:hypothetical protein